MSNKEIFIEKIDRIGIENMRVLVLVIELPSGALETTVNSYCLIDKVEHILNAYNDDLKLKTNTKIKIFDFIIG